MKQFELFMGHLGNGITVCNKAVQEHGDYKVIAHIANCGKITWYVKPVGYVPQDAIEKIKKCADDSKQAWEQWLDSIPESQQYKKLLDAVPTNIMLYAMSLGGGLGRKIRYLKKVCYEKAYF